MRLLTAGSLVRVQLEEPFGERKLAFVLFCRVSILEGHELKRRRLHDTLYEL